MSSYYCEPYTFPNLEQALAFAEGRVLEFGGLRKVLNDGECIGKVFLDSTSQISVETRLTGFIHDHQL